MDGAGSGCAAAGAGEFTTPEATRVRRHGCPDGSRSSSAMASRPRLQRDFTVPSATSRTAAASTMDRPCMSTRMSAIRCPSGSRSSASRTSSRVSTERVRVAVVGQLVLGQLARRLVPPQPVQAGVDHDPVQPGGDRRITPVGLGPAERGDEGVLHAVGGQLAVARRAQGHRPHPVAVPAEQLTERVRVALDVGADQLPVVAVLHRDAAHGYAAGPPSRLSRP